MGFADVVDLLLSLALVISSLSHFVSSFKDVAVVLNVLVLLAIIVGSIVPELAPASLICRKLGRTSSSGVRSVGLTLY